MRPVIILLMSLFFSPVCKAQHKVLIFHETQGYRHQSIENGIQAIQQLGDENDFECVVSRDSRFFTENDLNSLDLVIFLNTTGDIFNTEEQIVFQNYMDNGGNFLGIHSAADTEYKWSWYGDLVGAYFNGHPEIQKADLSIQNPEHISLAHLDEKWTRTDEWYNYKDINKGLNILLTIDERTYKGGTNGEFHPVAWYQNYLAGGKSVYTGLGHTPESYSEPDFLEHLSGCIRFALGKE